MVDLTTARKLEETIGGRPYQKYPLSFVILKERKTYVPKHFQVA